MLEQNYADYINKTLKEAEVLVSRGGSVVQTCLPGEIASILDIVLLYAERGKGVLAVVLTSLVYKIFHNNYEIKKKKYK